VLDLIFRAVAEVTPIVLVDFIYVDGVRKCFRTVATSGTIVHSPDDI
jgi:hypothetical protein